MEDDQPAEGEVSQTFVIGLIVAGVLLFGLFVWYTVVSGGATPL